MDIQTAPPKKRKSGKTSNASKAKYNEKAYDRLAVILYKGEGEEIAAHAKGWGMSVSAWGRMALLEKMQRDGPPPKMGAGAAEKEKA